jgi:hypothetical protein
VVKYIVECPVDLKTDCANLNLDKDVARITKPRTGFNENLSRVQTGSWTLPLFGVSALGILVS